MLLLLEGRNKYLISFSHSFSLFFSYNTKQKTKCRYHNFSLNISINQSQLTITKTERETDKHTQNNGIRPIRQHTKTSRQNHKIGISPRLVYAHQSKFMIEPCPRSSLDDCCCWCCHSNNKFLPRVGVE